MTRVRRQRRWLAALWLCSQMALLALTSSTIAAISGEARHCACPGTTEQVCVMHRGSAPAPLSTRQCAMRHSAAHDVTIVTVAPGFSPAPTDWLREAEARPAATRLDPVLTLARSVPPEAPPPRA